MIDYYKRSLEEFKRVLKNNPSLTREEWEEYAHKNCFFSVFTLCTHNNLDNFEQLKKKFLKKQKKEGKESDS